MSESYVNTNETNKTEERLFITKYHLVSFLKNIPKIIYMKDLNGNYVTGTKYSDVFFKNGFDCFENLYLDKNQIQKDWQKEDQYVIDNNEFFTSEKEVYDKSGIIHTYSFHKTPITNECNEVIGIIVIVQNIDAEKNLQAQRETFVASLGHDLKNPTLAQIRAIELLLKGEFGTVPQSQTEILDMVLDSCKYMKAMLSSLLATYRNERGIVKLHYEEINLIQLADECISEMIYMAKDKGVAIHVQENCSIPILYGDKVQIKRVIMNLLSNGIKYAFKESSIYVKLFNEINYTCFSMENRSPYIPPEKREAIFAQYVSFAEAHRELGIGLGLYASKKIINAHGGTISVESYNDNRNIFCFKVPNIPNAATSLPTVTF